MFDDLTPEQRQLPGRDTAMHRSPISPDRRTGMEKDRHSRPHRADDTAHGPRTAETRRWVTEKFGGLSFGPIEQQIFVNGPIAPTCRCPQVTRFAEPSAHAAGTAASCRRSSCRRSWPAGALHDRLHQAEAGTDLASLRTTAVRDGDHYIVNGRRVFTTGATRRRLHRWPAAPTECR